MEYDSMTVAELKDLLRDAGLPVSGKKADLIARLQEAADTPAEEGLEEMVEEEEIDTEEDDFESDDFFEDEWDDFHTARQKPVLDEDTKAALATRAAQRRYPILPKAGMVPLQASFPYWMEETSR